MELKNNRRDDTDGGRKTCDVVLYDEELIKQKRRKKVVGVAAFGAFALILAVVAFVCVFKLANGVLQKDTDEADALDGSAADTEWQGAFESRDMVDRCLSSCVSIRLGAVGEYGAPGVSGFVVSADGWLLSSDRLLQSTQRGRIYARFFDGREYAVETVLRLGDSGLSLMKIDAEGLDAAMLGSTEDISVGEKIVAIGSVGAPDHSFALYSGIVSGNEQRAWVDSESAQKSGLLRTDIVFESSSVGSPIFDRKGRVLGIALYENEKFILPIDQIRDKIDALQ
ncbi:MAG: trypsin-like peptidase domain-containing protein [Clostridia bacterium]|nr:trypsin-like peptidase domain-containing protein [Clostridia bacterium]